MICLIQFGHPIDFLSKQMSDCICDVHVPLLSFVEVSFSYHQVTFLCIEVQVDLVKAGPLICINI